MLANKELKATDLKNILLKVLSESGSTSHKVNAKQHFSVSADFLEKAEKYGGAVIINNYQSQAISIENKKQLVDAIYMLEKVEEEIIQIEHDHAREIKEIEEKKNLLAIRESMGFYDLAFEEIKTLGGIEAFYDEIMRQMAIRTNDNRTLLAKFLGISVRTIRNRIKKKAGKNVMETKAAELVSPQKGL